MKFSIQDASVADFEAIPTALICGLLKWFVHAQRSRSAVGKLPLLIAEARRRRLDFWALETLDPKRCACGGPGLYIVGRRTFCRKCRPEAVRLLATSPTQRRREEKRRVLDADANALDRGLRKIDRMKRSLSIRAYGPRRRV